MNSSTLIMIRNANYIIDPASGNWEALHYV